MLRIMENLSTIGLKTDTKTLCLVSINYISWFLMTC